ncbi:MAG: M56 family metallopeptidase [Verrucomicrobiales bacterium]|nr:M56 family metallopeptidase [Verrucomicrobiales bacterium]
MKMWWLDLAMVSTGTLAVTWALTVLLRRQSAAWRHLIWGLGFVATAVAWALLVSSWRVELPWLSARETVAVVADVDAVETVTVSEALPVAPLTVTPARAVDWWLVVWWSGAVLCLLPLTAGWWRVRRLLRNARLFADGRRVLVSADVVVPLTVGVFSPRIVLPTAASAWPAERVRRVLAHESAHGQRRDVAWALLARLVCALCWFNPLAWFAAHRQRVEAELACDDAVLAGGAAADDYATDLLQILRACPRGLPSPLTAGMAARPSQIKARLTALLAADVDRAAVKRSAARALTVGVLLAVAALTVVRIVHASDQTAGAAALSAAVEKPEGKMLQIRAKLIMVPKDEPALQSAEFKKAWSNADYEQLNQIFVRSKADLLSEPSLTLFPGQKTKIRAVREFRYPDAWDEDSKPTHFTQKDVGLTVDVLRSGWKDGKIALDLKLNLTEFINYINDGSEQKPRLRPVFKEQEKSLSCALADGEGIAEWMPDPTLTGEQEVTKDKRTALLLTARLVDQPPTVSVAERLQRIMIPRVKFTDAEVGEVLNYLQAQSKLHDPLKVGVNIVFKAEPTNASPDPDWHSGKKITLDLVEVSLGKILNLIQTLTLYKYEVTEQAVYVLPNIETSEVMLVRIFTVPENFFPEPRTMPEGKGISPEDADVRKELTAKGIEFLAGASAAYLPKAKKLVVRNTAGQLNKIAALLGSPPAAPNADGDQAAAPSAADTNTKQVEITASFFNVPKDAVTSKLAEFEKGWTGTGDERIKIMREAGADLYSEPRVTLFTGQRAKLRGMRELRYPAEWDSNQPANAGNDQPFTARQTGAIIGTTVNVKPKIQGDQIDLELELESTVIDGFTQHKDEQGKEITTPVLAARKLGSGAKLHDGQSVLFWFPKKDGDAEKTCLVLTMRLMDKRD